MSLKDPVAARKVYRKQYYKDHSEEIKQYNKDHSEEIKARKKQYYKDNREVIKQYNKDHREEQLVKMKQYRKDNSEKIKAYKKQYTKDHREEQLAYAKQYAKDHPEVSLRSQKKMFKKLGLTKWSMRAWTRVIRKDKNCSYCGSNKQLHSHHLIPKSKQPGLALNENNGIPLCDPCHREHHHLNGVN